LRQAIKQTLASAGSGNKRIMLKQQDALDNQVAKLRHGQPKTPQMAKEQQSGPKAGDVEGGYKFKGGDPADKNNWEKVQ
jgi:hypothetical protein